MPPKKSDKRQQTEPFQIRMRAVEREYLESGAEALTKKSPIKVGLGPYLKWAGVKQTEELTGITLEEFEKKRGNGGKKP